MAQIGVGCRAVIQKQSGSSWKVSTRGLASLLRSVARAASMLSFPRPFPVLPPGRLARPSSEAVRLCSALTSLPSFAMRPTFPTADYYDGATPRPALRGRLADAGSGSSPACKLRCATILDKRHGWERPAAVEMQHWNPRNQDPTYPKQQRKYPNSPR